MRQQRNADKHYAQRNGGVAGGGKHVCKNGPEVKVGQHKNRDKKKERFHDIGIALCFSKDSKTPELCNNSGFTVSCC